MGKTIIILLDKVFVNGDSDPRVYRSACYFMNIGYKVKLVCFTDTKLQEIELIDNIEVFRIIPEHVVTPRGSLSLTKKIAKKISDKLDYDVVLSNDHTMLNIAVKMKSIKLSKLYIHDSHEYFQDYRLIFEESDGIWLKFKSIVWRRIEMWKERSNAKKVDYWITVCTSLSDIFDKTFKLKNPSRVLRNFPKYDNKLMLKLDEVNRSGFDKLERIKNNYNLIYFGNYYKQDSGLESVLIALSKLPENVNLILLGTDKSSGFFGKIFNELGIKDRVLVIGRLSHQLMPEVSKYAKIGIVPTIGNSSLSRYYSLPNKLLECMKVELPIICTDLPEHVNLLKNTGSAEFIGMYNDDKTVQDILSKFQKIECSYDKYKLSISEFSRLHSMDYEYEKAFSFLKG